MFQMIIEFRNTLEYVINKFRKKTPNEDEAEIDNKNINEIKDEAAIDNKDINEIEGELENKETKKDKSKIGKKKFIFESLAPDNKVKLGTYKIALDEMIKNDTIFNVGLTGPYGSGKSSTIESYKKLTPSLTFIHISLGKYDSIDKQINNNSSSDRIEHEKNEVGENTNLDNLENTQNFKEMEGKIINQLLHQVDVNKVPQAFTKVKKNNSHSLIWIWSVLVPITVAFSIYLIMFENWRKLLVNNGIPELNFTTSPSARLFAALCLLILIGYLTFIFGKAQLNRAIIRKVSIRGNEVELFKDSENSFFDEHLNEVVYLFENSGADVIVFEDLDRFKNPDVFRKLRELNQLINKRKQNNLAQKDTQKKLVFLYLIKDDIFVSKDRTKFFDLIIPIVPVVSSSNSFTKMKSIFEENLKEGLQSSFLRKLSLFIDDMRLIKNIFNEYTIYNDRVNTSSLDQNKLLAMIAYKNIFPRDFSELQYEKGFVYSVLNDKKIIFNQEKARIDNEIANLKDDLEKLELTSINSIEKLKETYLKTDSILVDGKMESHFSSRLEYVREILKGNKLSKETYTRYNGSLYQKLLENVSLSTLVKTMEDTLEYQKEKIIVEDIKNGEKIKIKDKIRLQKLNRTQVEVRSLSEMISEDLFEKMVDGYPEIQENDYHQLIGFLLIEGYLDENYEDYMNYFYDNDLKREDKQFLRNLYSNSDNKPEERLKNKRAILEILEVSDYKRKGILNYSLSLYLISHKKKDELNSVLSVASQHDNYEFVLKLYEEIFFDISVEKTYNLNLFFSTLCSVWSDFFSLIIKINSLKENDDTNGNSEVLESFIFDGLIYLNAEDIDIQNSDKTLANYINHRSNLMVKVSEDNWDEFDKNGVPNLIHLDIQFNKLDHENLSHELMESIIKNNLYELNYENIEEIALNKGLLSDKSDNDTFKHENLTRIMNSGIVALKDRIKKNMNEYLELYLSFSENDIRDDKESAISVLNNIDVDRKNDYIESMNYHVDNLKEIDDDYLWTVLIEKNKVSPTIQNIVRYYHYSGDVWKQELINFVNNVQQEIKVNYKDVIAEFEKINFFKSTLSLNELSNSRYEDIIGKSNYKLNNDHFELEDLNDSKVNILMHHHIISMNTDNLNHIRAYHIDCLNTFIILNFDDYLELLTPKVNENEVVSLLNSELSIENQEKVLSKIGNSKKISMIGIRNNHQLAHIIIRDHLKNDDIKLIFGNFNGYDEKVKDQIVEVAIQNLQILLTEEIVKELVIAILMSKIAFLKKRELLINKIALFNFEEIIFLEPKLYIQENFSKIITMKRPTYKDNEFNRCILGRLEKLNIIFPIKLKNGRIIVKRKQ